MAKPVYSYFNIKALGEGPRLVMAYVGQEFEDVRISSEEWAKIKQSTPFGQLPTLQLNGKVYAQSYAMMRYFARKHGLAGDTPEEEFEIDQNIYYVNDILVKAAAVAYEKYEEIKAKKQADISINVYPPLLTKLSKIIEQNNGYIAVGKLTWADFAFVGMYNYLKKLMDDQDLDEKYPNFKKLHDTVYSLPQLQDYLAKRPQFDEAY